MSSFTWLFFQACWVGCFLWTEMCTMTHLYLDVKAQVQYVRSHHSQWSLDSFQLTRCNVFFRTTELCSRLDGTDLSSSDCYWRSLTLTADIYLFTFRHLNLLAESNTTNTWTQKYIFLVGSIRKIPAIKPKPEQTGEEILNTEKHLGRVT